MNRFSCDFGTGETLYFLHIPKTGGTSLRAYLERQFPPEAVCPQVSLEALLARPREDLARYRFIGGHYGLYLLKFLASKPRLVTLLREPLSRSVSHYRDICSRPDHQFFETVRRLSYEQFACSDLGESELLNLQCRFLALDDVERDLRGHERLRSCDVAGLRAKYTDPALLGRARTALASMAVVGTCERIDCAAAAIARLINRPPPRGRLNRLNSSRVPFRAEDLTPKAVRRTRELTELDRVLYDAVAGQHPTAIVSRASRFAAAPSQIPT